MKKRRWIFIVAICIIAIMLFRACSDDKHITQNEAEKIAKALAGGEVTFIKSEKGDTSNRIDYVFTDAKGNTFTITSSLAKPQIDGATVKVLPLDLSIHNDYYRVIVKNNEDKIREILERYGFGDSIARGINTAMLLEVNAGTPEENQEILEKFVAAGIEIDTWFGMNTDTDFLKKKHLLYEYQIPNISITFYTSLEDKDTREAFVDGTGFRFSISSDTRWTFDSLYEEVMGEIEKLEIAE